MTPRETLEKYNLKTDVKSIRERIKANTLWDGKSEENADKIYWLISEKFTDDRDDLEKITLELFDADLSLLCELAEKGERYENAVKNHREELEPHRHIDVCAPYAIRELDEIITELKGEPK